MKNYRHRQRQKQKSVYIVSPNNGHCSPLATRNLKHTHRQAWRQEQYICVHLYEYDDTPDVLYIRFHFAGRVFSGKLGPEIGVKPRQKEKRDRTKMERKRLTRWPPLTWYMVDFQGILPRLFLSRVFLPQLPGETRNRGPG
jgi:hypothetical protein